MTSMQNTVLEKTPFTFVFQICLRGSAANSEWVGGELIMPLAPLKDPWHHQVARGGGATETENGKNSQVSVLQFQRNFFW